MEGQDKQVDSNLQFKEERESQNYSKLKRKFKALREEYLKVLENWEDTHKKVKTLSKEKKFLRDKLECFLKSQHYNISDEALTAAIMAKNNDVIQHNNQVTAQVQKQSAIHSGHHQQQQTSGGSSTNTQHHSTSSSQNPQKRKKKDQMHHQYYPMGGQNQHPVQPIFGTQEVSKVSHQQHAHSGNHNSHINHQPMNPPQNIFIATNGNQSGQQVTTQANQQQQYLDQAQSRAPIFNTNLVHNGSRSEGGHSQKQALQQQHLMQQQQVQAQQPQIMIPNPEFQIQAQMNKIGQQQI